MKNNSLFLLLIFSLSMSSVQGQNSIVKTLPGLNGYNEIMREWEIGYSVAYVQTSDNTALFLIEDTNNAGQMMTIPLPTGLLVNDFEILPEEVYFCGSYDDAGVLRVYLQNTQSTKSRLTQVHPFKNVLLS